jgi:glyoxylase-like metal-dependent hydrolase (beta-lactamase superfamily II)
MPEAPTARYSWRLLRGGRFKLDGGSMFGLVPRAVWSRAVQPDDRGRITVQHNCLLLERSGPAPEPSSSGPAAPGTPAPYAPKLVLIETGSGDKLDPKSRDIFDLEDRSILDALAEVSCRPEEIQAVAVSHLHFDHAGGLTRLPRPGEKPDWTGPASAGNLGVKLTFPGACIFTQAREWSDALANRSVMTRTYFRDHLEPIRDHLALLDSPRPFPPGTVPDRDQAPMAPVELRKTPIAPGLWALLTPGHTWGQQAILFTDTRGRTIAFTPDVMPTAAHLGAAYSLGYDVEPYTSMVSRRWFLQAAAEEGWVLVLDHEPGHPCFRVRANDKGWFDLIPEEPGA